MQNPTFSAVNDRGEILPFLIEQEKQTPTSNKRRKRFLKRLQQSSDSSDFSD